VEEHMQMQYLCHSIQLLLHIRGPLLYRIYCISKQRKVKLSHK